MNGPLILLGSARAHGETARAVRQLTGLLPVGPELIDLSTIDLRPFRYEGEHDDAFRGIVERMLAHRAILFATPVYWYAMSGIMKTLFDRFSDLLSDRDGAGRGRRLAGRDMWMLAVGADPEMPAGFDVPFIRTADYLGLTWRGACYVRSGGGHGLDMLPQFAAAVAAALGPDK